MHLKQLRLGLRLTLHSELNAHSFVNLLMSCRSKVECQSTVCTVSGGPTKRLERTRHERASLVRCVGEPLKRSVGRISFLVSANGKANERRTMVWRKVYFPSRRFEERRRSLV